MITYQPSQNCRRITAFSDKFLEIYTTVASFGKNIIIVVDFNVQVDDKNDLDRKQFRDSLEVMGLDQHVYFPVHVSGHALYLILSENGSSLNVQEVSPGPSFSDNQSIVTEKKMKRKWSELNVEKFFQHLDLNNLTVYSEDLTDYMDKFNERITFNLDNKIP